jgi:hypothetical protein
LTRVPRAEGERGAVMVVFTLLLVVLLGIAALVVDLGYGREKKRQIQNAVDAAALAAAQDLVTTNLATSEATAKSYAADNLPGGNFDWAGCADANRPANFTPAVGGSPCISFDPSFSRVRVRMPRQTFATGFARVLGFNSLSTGAVAQARVVTAGYGSVLPFGLYSGFSSGLTCLKTASGGLSQAPCTDPVTGNFNLLDITQYGNETLQTPARCGNSFQLTRMIDNLAIGVDHELSIWTAARGDVVDACSVFKPNVVPPRTGNDQSAFDTGMLHATSAQTSNGAKGRLQQTIYNTAVAAGVPIDNKPVWEYIPTGLTDVPLSCQRETFNQALATFPPGATKAQKQAIMQAKLQACFTDYETGGYTTPVFTANTNPTGEKEVPVDMYDIQLSGRFAYVPQFAEATPPNGNSGDLTIASFRPIFIQELFAGCNGNTCSVQFEPGPWNVGNVGNSNDQARAITGWVFDVNMLPINLRTLPSAIGQNKYVQLEK